MIIQRMSMDLMFKSLVLKSVTSMISFKFRQFKKLGMKITHESNAKMIRGMI